MEHRRYITRRRARFQSMSGPVNLPWGTEAENRDGFLWRGDKQLCAASAQNTKEFFVQDDDGQGQERGQLINANGRAVHAIANIGRVYDDRLKKHDFL